MGKYISFIGFFLGFTAAETDKQTEKNQIMLINFIQKNQKITAKTQKPKTKTKTEKKPAKQKTKTEKQNKTRVAEIDNFDRYVIIN